MCLSCTDSSFVDDGSVVKVSNMIECAFVIRIVRAFNTFHCVSDMFSPSGFERPSMSLKMSQNVNDFNV